ncbi:MAG: hypothetical protein ICV84_15940 [Flavisolibacter sp.]|nr:hypothetical protein [Flavisolibacter sp.]
MERAIATENVITPLTRFDENISNGIVYTIKEQNITDVLIGLHHSSEQSHFLGPIAESILKKTFETIYIYKSVQPVNTLKRMIVAVPPKAELEPGFTHWFLKLNTIAKEAGMSISFYAAPETIRELQHLKEVSTSAIQTEFNHFTQWEDFLIFSRELKPNDLFVIVSSRKGSVSYNHHLDKLSYYLSNYFNDNSFILLYPKQLEHGIKMGNIEHADTALMETITGKAGAVGKAGNYLKGMFRKKEK